MNRLPCLAILCACAAFSSIAAAAPPTYDIYAIRYGGLKDVPVNALVPKADPARKIDTAFMIWLIRGQGRNILVDAGFHRDQFIRQWHPVDYVEPSKAIARLGLKPEDITDIVMTHLHWDHADGVDLFPNAHIWIQKDELAHYANEAAQHPNNAGVFAEDVAVLVALEKRGRVTRIDGDEQTIFPESPLISAANIRFNRSSSASTPRPERSFSRATMSICTRISINIYRLPRRPMPKRIYARKIE